MPDLTREALIEAADAAITGAYHHTVDWQTSAAAGAVDAVLTTLADDLADSRPRLWYSNAAVRIRCLLPSTEGDKYDRQGSDYGH